MEIRAGRRAFTLFELLAVLALIGIVAGLVVVDFVGLAGLHSPPSDYESLRQAVEAAQVASSSQRVSLRYVEAGAALVLSGKTSIASFPLSRRVTFWLPEDENGGKSLRLEALTFAPEGDATPARILLEGSGGRSVAFRLEPFSTAIAEERE